MSDPRHDPPRAVLPPAPGFSPGRLDGWKDIAAYLRRSVRTVQRWESQFGLPVHRFNVGHSEAVYGVPAELDAWLLQSAAARAAHDDANGNGAEPAAQPSEQAAGAGAGEARSDSGAVMRRLPRRGLLTLGVAAGALLFLVAFNLGWLGPSRADVSPAAPSKAARAPLTGPPRSLAVDRRTLILRDEAGRETGRHEFAADLVNLTQPDELEKLAVIADLNGDGSVEVAIAVTTEGVQSVFVLKADGTEMMRWRPFRAVRYGQGAPLGPGLVFTQVWPASPRDGTFYVAGHVPIEFASVLVHLDMGGQVLHEYWSNGYVESFARLEGTGRPRWLVGAAHNETGGGSLAVFDGPPQGSAPARSAHYRCGDCPPGAPSQFYVFPRSRLQRRVGLNASVVGIEDDLSGGALVRVNISGAAPAANQQLAHYFLGPDLRVRHATVGDSFPGVVDRLIAQRWLGVTESDRYRGAGDLFPVMQWNVGQGRFDALPPPEGIVPTGGGFRIP